MIIPNITEVRYRSKEGATRPFYCIDEDGRAYYVKGVADGRRGLVAEYVCTSMARTFGLPVPDCRIVNVTGDVGQRCEDFGGLGAGYAFASLVVPDASLMKFEQCRRIPVELKRDILVFDWWVKNPDRILSVSGGDPNLLWRDGSGRPVVIDFNRAFDPDFDPVSFIGNHVFGSLFKSVVADEKLKKDYETRFGRLIEVFTDVSNEIPGDWWAKRAGEPAPMEGKELLTVLNRFNKPGFWDVSP